MSDTIFPGFALEVLDEPSGNPRALSFSNRERVSSAAVSKVWGRPVSDYEFRTLQYLVDELRPGGFLVVTPSVLDLPQTA